MNRALIIFVGCTILAACNPFEDELNGVCEEVLKDRLRSPSTYQRVKISRSEKILTRNEYLSRLVLKESFTGKDFGLRMFDEGQYKPKVVTLLIESDAANAYGTPIRGYNTCEYFSEKGKDDSPSRLSVRVDGKTSTDWLIDRIKKQ